MHKDERNVLLIIFGLLAFGLVQVYSSSLIYAGEKFGNELHFVYRQMIFSVVGFGLLLCCLQIPYKWIEKYALYIWPAVSLFVLVTLVPSIGVKVGGARRWLDLPFGFRLEPSEYLKLALPFFVATAIQRYDWQKDKREAGLLGAIFLIPLIALLNQPDFGSFVLLLLVALALVFVAGLAWRWIVLSGGLASLSFYFLVLSVPYRKARVMAFLDPWQNPQSTGFQTIQSMISFRGGGFWGKGLGAGQSKLYFLPEAHTDYTLAVLGEEAGFFGFFLLLLAYAFLMRFGFRLANQAKSFFQKTVSLGLVLVFSLSVFINMGVVLGLLPTKGLTLPFISYGGSSLIMFCLLWGLLLNINKACRKKTRVYR